MAGENTDTNRRLDQLERGVARLLRTDPDQTIELNALWTLQLLTLITVAGLAVVLFMLAARMPT